jgi:hypothetical protein
MAARAIGAMVYACLAAACGGGGSGGESCTGDVGDPSCGGSACGGDPTGVWMLASFCGPSCVVSVASEVEYRADGTYIGGGGTGTWSISGGMLTTTVGTGTSTAEYCVQGDRIWTQRFTNCGSASGALSVTRRRDCGATTDAGRL